MRAASPTGRAARTYDPVEGRRLRQSRRRSRQRAATTRRRLLGGAVLALDAALVALFGAGYAARYVPPPTAWPVQVAALALPPAAALVAVAAVGWLGWAARARTRWAWAGAAAHLGLAVLAASRYGPALLPSGELGPVREGTLRVLTLNAGGSGPTAFALAADAARLGRPDLVALQETAVRTLDGGGGGRRIAGNPVVLGLLTEPGYTAVSSAGEDRLAVLVGRDVAARWTVGGPLDPADVEGGGVVGRFVVEGGPRPFALYVVHFRSYGRSGGPLRAQAREVQGDLAARAREARLLRSILDAEDLPFLVLGDFNATPDQWTYAHVADGLHDALVGRAGWAPTYPDARPLVQIDAVLASPEWEVEAAEVLPGGLSDHRGVLADLRLSERARD